VSTNNNGARLHTVATPHNPTAAVLVFHGGSATSLKRVSSFSPAVLRLIPVAYAIAAQQKTAAVYRLRFSVRGWNGSSKGAGGNDVLRDARWALDQIAATHPGLPIVVVGHSLGGRVAMHVAGLTVGPGGSSTVIGAVGLAPWVDPADPVGLLDGVPLSVVQGTRDRIVPEPSTRAWLAKAAAAGARVESTLIEGAGHAMLRYFRRWHQLTADGVASVLAAAEHPAARR
jgi:alpha-beta hydrolase superfamily lysophospholipase